MEQQLEAKQMPLETASSQSLLPQSQKALYFQDTQILDITMPGGPHEIAATRFCVYLDQKLGGAAAVPPTTVPSTCWHAEDGSRCRRRVAVVCYSRCRGACCHRFDVVVDLENRCWRGNGAAHHGTLLSVGECWLIMGLCRPHISPYVSLVSIPE
jgi:hypothetical protein